MSFNSNVAPRRIVKETVERGPWACKCSFPRGLAWARETLKDHTATAIAASGQDYSSAPGLNHPGLKRCGTCGEARP